jgi:predicted ATPase
MITQIAIKDFENSVIPWAEKIEFFQKPIKFADGINILFGKNATGKSTLLTAIAKMMFCYQGGKSVVTQNSLHEMFPIALSFGENKDSKEKRMKSIEVLHDGTSVRYFAALKNYGSMGASFDDDFFDLGVASLNNKELSAGQQTLYWFNLIVQQKLTKKIEYSMDKNHVNDLWKEYIELAEKALKPKIPEGNPTLLIDEGEKGLDFVNASNFWQMIKKSKGVQLIIASHSPFCLFVEGANYIEMTKGYLEESRKIFKGMKT